MTTWSQERAELEEQWFATAAQGIASTFVYRYYDARGRLLYVGQTINVERRHRGHRTKRWYGRVARREVAGPMTKDLALAHEFAAITRENPLHNRTESNGYVGPGSTTWLLAEAEAYQQRCADDPAFAVRHMAEVLDGFAALKAGAPL